MDIVFAIKNGDELAFQKVFKEYHQKLYFFILQKTRSEYLAEETMQLAFIKLWNYKESLKEEYTISTQLFRIASTILIDLLRKQNNATALSKKLSRNGYVDIATNDTQESIDQREVNRQLSAALNHLPPVRRKVFEMSRFEGLSYSEIAVKLSISPKTVEVHISKAIKQLRHALPFVVFIIATESCFLFLSKVRVEHLLNV